MPASKASTEPASKASSKKSSHAVVEYTGSAEVRVNGLRWGPTTVTLGPGQSIRKHRNHGKRHMAPEEAAKYKGHADFKVTGA